MFWCATKSFAITVHNGTRFCVNISPNNTDRYWECRRWKYPNRSTPVSMFCRAGLIRLSVLPIADQRASMLNIWTIYLKYIRIFMARAIIRRKITLPILPDPLRTTCWHDNFYDMYAYYAARRKEIFPGVIHYDIITSYGKILPLSCRVGRQI